MRLRALAEGWIKRALARAGVAVARRPTPMLVRPGAELGVSLAMVAEHYLAHHRHEGFFFVQIGAFDGTTNDPIRPLVERHRWNGVLVEPQQEAFSALVSTYSDQPQVRLENVAVGPEPGTMTLYRVDPTAPGLPPWAPQLATFRRETLLSHRREIPGIEELIQEVRVECVTFDALLERAGSARVDLLQIDAEGFDGEILSSVDLARHRPAIVRYEHKHLDRRTQDTCVERLLDHGYRVAIEPEDTLAYRVGEE